MASSIVTLMQSTSYCYWTYELMLTTSCPIMQLVGKKLRIGDAVLAISSENAKGNEYHDLLEGTIWCKGSNLGSLGR
jgi:hypothetical protein